MEKSGFFLLIIEWDLFFHPLGEAHLTWVRHQPGEGGLRWTELNQKHNICWVDVALLIQARNFVWERTVRGVHDKKWNRSGMVLGMGMQLCRLSLHGCSLAWLGTFQSLLFEPGLCWCGLGTVSMRCYGWGHSQLRKGRDSRSLCRHLCSCVTDFLLHWLELSWP